MAEHSRATVLPDLAGDPKSNWQMTMVNDNVKMASRITPTITITQLELGDFSLFLFFCFFVLVFALFEYPL